MLRVRHLIGVFLLAIPFAAHGSVALSGANGAELPQALRRAAQVWQRSGPNISTLADSARVWLAGNGYLEGAAEIAGETLTVLPGPRYVLDYLLIGGDTIRPANGGTYLTHGAVERLTSELLQNYYRQGHYYARVTVDSVTARDGRAALYASGSEGPLVTVGQCRFEGLKRTRGELVSRYLVAQPGDTVTDALIRRANLGAAAIPFLRNTQELVVTPRPGFEQADLLFRFEERQQVSLIGGVGYVADADRKLLFNLDLTLRNLFGDGRTVGWLADHREANNNVMRLSYGQPLFLTGVGWLETSVQTRDYRDLFYEFGATVGYQARSGEAMALGLNLGYKRVEPATGPDSYHRYAVELTLGRYGADDPFNPRSGLDLTSSISFAYRRYAIDSGAAAQAQSLEETHAGFGSNLYVRLVGPALLRVGVGYRGFETSEGLPPISELLLIGGPGSLRGYRTEQFAVQRAALGTVEPRLRFESGFLFAFCDFAYLNRPVAQADGSVRTDERFRYGYGAGFGMRDGRRSVKLGLAWNPDVALDQPRVTVELSTDL
jgi:outer membrane protein assembly factor BamA